MSLKVLTKPDYKFHQNSEQPKDDIEKISYPGQPAKMKMYRSGYEIYMDIMPVLEEGDPFLDEKIQLAKNVAQSLATELKESSWIYEDLPKEDDFNRTIIGIEPPLVTPNGFVERAEFVVAKWGNGHTSPVHGHSSGYMLEEILYGKMRVNTYRMTSKTSNVVRPVMVEIVEKGTFVSRFNYSDNNQVFKRQSLIHNFTSIGNSASLHYLPEHTRDGRDNRFEVEYFDDFFDYNEIDYQRITGKEGLYSRIGDVILVRSTNVPDYGDHYIVITGPNVMKEHGLRPTEVAIPAPTNTLLDKFEPINGLTLLKLSDRARVEFFKFHDIAFEKGKVIFPNA